MTTVMLSAIQAAISAVMMGVFVRILIIPFKIEPQTRTRIFYRTAAGVGAFMFTYYQWLAPK